MVLPPAPAWIGCQTWTTTSARRSATPSAFSSSSPRPISGVTTRSTRRPHVINTAGSVRPARAALRIPSKPSLRNSEAAASSWLPSAGRKRRHRLRQYQRPPALYAEAFSVGAFDSTNTLADVQQPGPGDGGRVRTGGKPDLVAPGVRRGGGCTARHLRDQAGQLNGRPARGGGGSRCLGRAALLARDIAADQSASAKHRPTRRHRCPPCVCGRGSRAIRSQQCGRGTAASDGARRRQCPPLLTLATGPSPTPTVCRPLPRIADRTSAPTGGAKPTVTGTATLTASPTPARPRLHCRPLPRLR